MARIAADYFGLFARFTLVFTAARRWLACLVLALLIAPSLAAPFKPVPEKKSLDKVIAASPARLPPSADPAPLPTDIVPPHLAVPAYLGGTGGSTTPAAASPATTNPATANPSAAPSPAPAPAPTAAPQWVSPPSPAPATTPAAAISTTYAREPKLALVIGNSSYREAPLANPVNDARAVTLRLQQLGFTVIKRENGTREEMLKVVRDFGNQLKNGGVGLFYFAGHGIQSRGINYLIPVDADIASEDELSTRGYNLSEVIEKMDGARNRLNIVVLDACRNNPFARSFRSASRGLARIDQSPTGMLIAYATAPGSTAADGSSGNGLYSEQFLRVLAEPGLKLEELFRKVRVNVKERSNGEQIPWEMSSVTGDFYFNPLPEQANAALGNQAPASQLAQLTQSSARELAPVLLPKRLLDNYQLVANIPLTTATGVARFSADSQLLAVATPDNLLRVIDARQGNVTQTRPNFGRPSFATDGRYVLGLGNGTISLGDLHEKLSLITFQDLGEGLTQATLTPSGKHILVHSARKGFRLLNIETAQWVAQIGDVAGEPQFQFSPHGRRLLVWGSTGTALRLWDLDKASRVASLTSHWKPASFARFSPDGEWLLTASALDRMVIWRTSDGDDVQKLAAPDNQPAPQFAEFIDDNRRLLLAFPDGKLTIWDVKSGKLVNTLASDLNAKHLRLSADRQKLFASGRDGNLRVFDLSTNSQISLLVGMEFIETLAEGRRLIVRDSEGLRLLDATSLSPLGRMPGQITAFATQKPSQFVTSAADGKLAFWDSETGDAINQLKAHLDTVTQLQFAPNNRHFYSIGNDRLLKLWGLPEVEEVGQLTKDQFESTTEYQKRLANWTSPYRAVVTLAEYNADTELYTVKIGDTALAIRQARDEARKLAGQKQAVLEAQLKFFDAENLLVVDGKLGRLP